ncbi:colicin immunity domain-containing protein [Enterobacteriaceae bacterium LUAb1]
MSFNQNESTILSIIDAFVSGGITAPEFEAQYSTAWRAYRDSDSAKEADHDTQRFFDSVFSTVDSYCSDPELIDKDALDEQGLLDEVINLQTSWKL